ncbi:MAG: RluA family pseudouridine synthase [Lachnospiraceae bacterium]|nr:RluA family pseudouridine synthase [Lachnospiraceae bacterium]
MKRAINYIIEKEDEGRKISGFLRGRGYSYQNLVELKKIPESVVLNGEPVFLNARLNAGDALKIRIIETESSEHIPPADIPLDIVYEDGDIIVLNKPAGMPTHPSRNNYDNTLANGLAKYFRDQGEDFVFRCTNRLDRDTSGLILVSKHMVSASIMGDMVRERRFSREYLAICKGSVTPNAGTIDVPLGRKSGSIIERCVDFENGERAVTHYEVVKEASGHSLVKLKLDTGRTHQIRIHMKYLGFPLIGDYLYNPDYEHMNRQALHSYRIEFDHPVTGEHMKFTCPLPEDMRWMEEA